MTKQNKNNSKDLLLEIVQCPNFINCEGTPCEKIVKSQLTLPRQVPEPWNGLVDSATIIFLSSNPSYNSDERFPTSQWHEDETVEFFNHRFSDQNKFVRKNLYVQLLNGEYSKNWVRFWARIKNIASLLLDKQAVPGIDYILTEIVRCKSIKEIGVIDALEECSSRYLERTLFFCRNAELLVLVGKKASRRFRKIHNIDIELPDKLYPFKIGKKEVLILELPHPNAREGVDKGLLESAKNFKSKLSGS